MTIRRDQITSSGRVRIDSGSLRHVVAIERYVETQDDVGQPIKAWATFASVHAEVRQLTGRELFLAQERMSEANVMIVFRYLPGVDTTMRIRHQGEVYNILDVSDVDSRHVRIECTCQTGLIADE